MLIILMIIMLVLVVVVVLMMVIMMMMTMVMIEMGRKRNNINSNSINHSDCNSSKNNSYSDSKGKEEDEEEKNTLFLCTSGPNWCIVLQTFCHSIFFAQLLGTNLHNFHVLVCHPDFGRHINVCIYFSTDFSCVYLPFYFIRQFEDKKG